MLRSRRYESQEAMLKNRRYDPRRQWLRYGGCPLKSRDVSDKFIQP